jgi:DNA-binding MarR family transcriptional regulator
MNLYAHTPALETFSTQVVDFLPYLFRQFIRMESNDLVTGKITFPQMVALDALMRQKRLKMNELAKLMSVKMSSATVLADRLIAQGLLRRNRDAEDRRIVWLSLSSKGVKIIKRIREEKKRSIIKIFGGLTPRERGAYLQILSKVQSRFTTSNP